MGERNQRTPLGEPSPEDESQRQGASTSEALPQLSDEERRRLLQAWKAVYRLLRYRPRTEAELRQALRRRGFSGDIIEAVLAEAREMRWVDDRAFAHLWVEQRSRSRPRAVWVLARELRERGVPEEFIDDALAHVDEGALARAAAEKAWRRYRSLPWPEARRRLAQYLARRGFPYELIHDVLASWEAHPGSHPDDTLDEEREP